MIKQTSVVNLANGVKLHLINSSKFKTVLTGIYIKRPLRPVEASYNALLSRVMDRATRKLPNLVDLSNALEYNYGSIIVTDVHKYGEKQLIQIKMSYPNEKYLPEIDFYEKPLSLLNDILCDPLIVDGGFDPFIFEQAKTGLISEIEMRKEDRSDWAISNCIETMAAEEPYAIHEYGTVEWVESITPQSLYAHFLKIIEESEIDIIVIGDIDEDRITKLYREHLNIPRGNVNIIPREQIIFDIKEVKYFEEQLPVTQGRLVMGYRMNIPYESDEYSAAYMATIIIGGGGSSRLFLRVREKEALCYTVYARADKFKSIMLVYAGIDPDQYDKAVNAIKEELQKLQEGQLLEKELETAQGVLAASLDSVSDFQNSYINYYYGQYMLGNEVNIEEHKRKLLKVTVEQVVAASRKLQLDTIAFINREDVHE